MNETYLSVLNRVNELTGVDILKKTRSRKAVEARSLFYYYLSICLKASDNEISDFLMYYNNKTHRTTVLYGVKMFEIYQKYNSNLSAWLNDLKIKIDSPYQKRNFIAQQAYLLTDDNVNIAFEFIENISGNQTQYKKEMINKLRIKSNLTSLCVAK
tara:strand:+ start:528 stop:995 length:468 start_codon:yes stop_codon:yes gene_type:complete